MIRVMITKRKSIEVVATSRTRNAVVRKGTWVRIPPLPPNQNKPSYNENFRDVPIGSSRKYFVFTGNRYSPGIGIHWESVFTGNRYSVDRLVPNLIVHYDLSVSVRRMQKMVRFFSERLNEKILIQFLNRYILVRFSELETGIRLIDMIDSFLSDCVCNSLRLASASDASSGTAHNLDKGVFR